MNRLSHCIAVSLLLLGLGCGGHFKYRISDAVLADVPVAEKQAMLDVKEEQARVHQARAKAGSERAIAERDLTAAQAEYKIANLEVKKVRADVELAKGTTDQNRMERAKERLAVAELGSSTAQMKQTWRKQRVKFAQQEERTSAAQEHFTQARYEQEKAKLVVAKGKQPYNKFNLSQFDLQASEAQTAWDKERVEGDKLRQEILTLEGQYQELQRQLAAARSAAPAQAVPPAPPLGVAAPPTP